MNRFQFLPHNFHNKEFISVFSILKKVDVTITVIVYSGNRQQIFVFNHLTKCEVNEAKTNEYSVGSACPCLWDLVVQL